MAEAPMGPSESGTVVLDLDQAHGALVVYTDADMIGVEIEISPADAPDQRSHVQVRERRLPAGSCYALVYPSLPEGTYTLWAPAGAPAGPPVRVQGGTVNEIHWHRLTESSMTELSMEDAR